MSQPIVEVKHLTKRFVLSSRQYGFKNIVLHLPQYIHDRRNQNIFTALNDMTFSVERGERVGLVGHNGCGKTTLLSVIGGVYRDYEGEVHVRGGVSRHLCAATRGASEHVRDVRDVRHVFERHRLGGQQRRRDHRQGSILVARHAVRSRHGGSPFYQKFPHGGRLYLFPLAFARGVML